MSLPPSEIPLGAMRFNSDSQKLEYWNGSAWFQIQTFSPNLDGGVRGLFGGGEAGANNESDRIDFITISTQGDATDFGNLSASRSHLGGCADRTRGLFMGGRLAPGGHSDTVDFVTISSTGHAADFGNLTQSRSRTTGFNNSTRGVRAGGDPFTDTIDFATIQSTGDFLDFGNLVSSRRGIIPAASPTRGIMACGQDPSSGNQGVNTIEFVVTSTTGNTSDFGDAVKTRRGGAGCSNSVRAVFGTGYIAPAPSNTASSEIDFITIATLGNAVSFGDLKYDRIETYGAVASPTRAVFGSGNDGSDNFVNTIDYVQIMSTGDGVDFGDLSQVRGAAAGCSNGNGGLG